MTLQTAALLGPYEILSPLGVGGMGEVYRAKDMRLGREVAVKVISEQLTDDPKALVRFEREAKAVAALSHPNILAIHDFGREGDLTYAVMELLEGETLHVTLARGPLPVSKCIEVAGQIARGLAAAHVKGIVHRDLKPANVFLTKDGLVKILDFGLARVEEPEPQAGDASLSDGPTVEAHTRPGVVMGTVGYMSPEQARGLPADARSDIFAFGVVLYEMLSGKRAFHGGTASDTLAAILVKDPEPLPPVTPPGVDRIVKRCLEKRPEDRFQSAHDMALALEAVSISGESAPSPPQAVGWVRWHWLTAIAGAMIVVLLAVLLALDAGGLRSRWFGSGMTSAVRSIAVLPLANLSNDSNQEYFVDGMTEELITSLAKIGSLKVISRTSTMKYKGTRKGLPQIAKELNVDALIEGSVLREGDRVRITAQLIQASTDQHLWAESYARDLRSVMELQSEIARAIAEKVHAVLSPEEESRLVKNARPVDPEAYELYLKGKFYLNKMTPEGNEKGLAFLNQAIEKDPSDPRSYAALAAAYAIIGHDGFPDAFERARAAAHKAEELGGEPPAEMLVAFGLTKLCFDWDYTGAAQDLRRAIELNPSIGEAYRDYAWYLFLIGRREEALAVMRRAQEAEPLTPLFYADRAWQYLWMGQFDRAIEEASKGLEVVPDFGASLCAIGMAYAEKGMYEEAIAAHRKLASARPGWRWALPRTLAQAGRPEEARETLTEFLRGKPKATGAWAGWFLAETYAALGDKDEAFRWLEAAYRERHSFLPWLLDNPFYASLHSDPRWKDLVRRMNLPFETAK